MNRKVSFALSLIMFWIKGQVETDTRFVKIKNSNTVLGFIPAGSNNQTIPLKNISATQINSSYKIMPMIIGIIFMFIGLSQISNSFMSFLIFGLIGVGLFGSGILTTLAIQRAGNDYIIAVPFFEKAKLLEAQDMIEEALAHDADKTDLNLYMNRKDEA
ncbi:hypothetical protein LAU42_02240 [Macrococcus armenti]|uniref:Uncharacterized protein n=1 Tax=Macrococcoides canis TaxID=1855823 RepID=A0AAE6X0L3_9STAP|nr:MULTISPECIES: hypothetical protein [Macrococcus]QIH77568.1 hypothetical protein GTN30_02720 [Macrococcus canis]QTQ08581.1 hypothetical protein J9174_02580 [Macrococcus canis]UBH22778.1 hypothetical protein LAU42_02240 [Macrococcus armenti]